MHVETDKRQADHERMYPVTRYANHDTEFRGVTYNQLRMYETLYPPITPAATIRLVRLARSGDEEALDLLIKHNARRIMLFAIQGHTGCGRNNKPAMRTMHRGYILSLEDAIAASMEGFWQAVKTYDERRWSPVAGETVRFSSWANFIMHQRVGAAITKERRRRERYPLEEHGGDGCDDGDTADFPSRAMRRGQALGELDANPEAEAAKDELWRIIEETVGESGRRVIEEWQCTLPRGRRMSLAPKYHAVIKRLRKKLDPETLYALRKAICLSTVA